MKKNKNQTPSLSENNLNPSLPLSIPDFQVPTITDQATLKEATSLLSRLNRYQDSIIEYKEAKTKPLNEALRIIRAETKPYEVKVQAFIDDIRQRMTTYQTNLILTNKAKEDSIASRIASGKGNLSLDTAIKKIEALPTIEKEIATEEGLVQFREKKTLKVIDLTLIPDMYWHINEEELLADLKKGITIPGAEIETIQVPVNYR